MDYLLGYLAAQTSVTRTFYSKVFNNEKKLVALTDAAFANSGDAKSTSGFLMFYNGSLVTANSSTQNKVATSAPEAELFEILRTTKELYHISGLLQDFGEMDLQTTILTDSASTVRTVVSPISRRYKYLSVYIAFLKEMVKEHGLHVVHLNREYNFADMLTKATTALEFTKQWNKIIAPFRWVHKNSASKNERGTE